MTKPVHIAPIIDCRMWQYRRAVKQAIYAAFWADAMRTVRETPGWCLCVRD